MRWIGIVLFAVLCGVAGAGENWPTFRGPNGDGVAEASGLPVEWSEETHVSWKTTIPGIGWSSPVVWGIQVWVTTATEEGSELSFLVIDRSNGDVLHEQVAFVVAHPTEKHKFNSYASPTPVLDERRAYLSWGSSGLVCVDRTSFEPVWTRRDLECNHYRGPGSSPILFGDLLIGHYDGFDLQYVIALDKHTGDTVWRTERPFNFGTDDGDKKKAYATPIVIQAGGREQLISPTSMGTFAYDPHTGEEIWRVRYEQFSTANRPLYDGEQLYISTGFSRAEVMAIDPTGTGDVTDTHLRWRELKAMPSKPSPLLIDGLLYLFNDKGIATCLESQTGEVVWQKRLGGNYSASPVYVDGRIHVFSEEGNAFVLNPGREFEQLAENTLDEGCIASPAVADDALFVRTRTHLYRIE